MMMMKLLMLFALVRWLHGLGVGCCQVFMQDVSMQSKLPVTFDCCLMALLLLLLLLLPYR
jgi:hypothetical protein